MKRIIMMVLRNILLVPWMWAKLCYHASHVDKYTEEEHYRMLQFITHRANKDGNVWSKDNIWAPREHESLKEKVKRRL